MLYGVHLMKSVLAPRYLTNHRNENLTFKNYIYIPLHLNWHKCSFQPVTSYFLWYSASSYLFLSPLAGMIMKMTRQEMDPVMTRTIAAPLTPGTDHVTQCHNTDWLSIRLYEVTWTLFWGKWNDSRIKHDHSEDHVCSKDEQNHQVVQFLWSIG